MAYFIKSSLEMKWIMNRSEMAKSFNRNQEKRREWRFSLILSLIGWGEWIQHLFNLSVIRKKYWNDTKLCFEVFETNNLLIMIIIDTQTSSMKDITPKHFDFIIWFVFVNDWIFQTLFFRQTINSYLLHLSYSHSLSKKDYLMEKVIISHNPHNSNCR